MANGKGINWFAILVVAILAYAFVPAINNTVNGWIGLGGTPGTAAVAVTGTSGTAAANTICIYDGATMTIGPMQKAFAPGYAVTGEYARVFVNGVDKGLKKDSSTMGVTYGDKIDVYYAENATGYYAAKQAFVVPCTSSFSTADPALDGDKYKVIANSSSTSWKVQFFNDDDGLLNTAANNESIAAADSANVEMKITWPSKTGLSPYGDVVVTCLYNASLYDDLGLSSNEVTVGATPTPTFRANAISRAGWNYESWQFGGWATENAKVVKLNLNIDSDDTNDPHQGSGGAGAGTSNISCWVDDSDWYKDGVTGAMKLGTESDVDADVGSTSAIVARVAVR